MVQCSVSLVAIFACTKKPELLEFAKTFVTAVGICIVGYSFTGCCGYLTFGSCVEADVLSSYPPTPDVVVCISLIAIHVCTTYPILLYIGRYRHNTYRILPTSDAVVLFHFSGQQLSASSMTFRRLFTSGEPCVQTTREEQ